jgi:hypothetical protein
MRGGTAGGAALEKIMESSLAAIEASTPGIIPFYAKPGPAGRAGPGNKTEMRGFK